MPDDIRKLPLGLYERLVTLGLNKRLLQFDPARVRVRRQPLDRTEAAGILAKHVERILLDLIATCRIVADNVAQLPPLVDSR